MLHSRTLEIFQGLGLDEQVTHGSVPEKGFVFFRNGELIGESPHAPIDSPFPFGMSQSQAHTEATLESHLNSLGVEVEREVSLTAIEQDEDGVTVTLRHEDMREETGRYQWLVACDGGLGCGAFHPEMKSALLPRAAVRDEGSSLPLGDMSGHISCIR